MRVYLSADMEGASGVAAAADVVRGESGYDRGVDLLTGDVNAAVAGAIDAGADEVVVNDAHADMRNLDPGSLHEGARLLRGSSKPRGMLEGLEPGHDVACFVGYHAKAGTPRAVLNHTYYAASLVALRIDGREVGEIGVNARIAAGVGVPVGLVTGDDAAIAEVEEDVGDVETVSVKTGIDRFSADCRPPSETREEIRAAAARAVERGRSWDLPVPELPAAPTIEAEWATTNLARAAAGPENVERVDGRTTRVTTSTYPAVLEAAIAMVQAGGRARNDHFG